MNQLSCVIIDDEERGRQYLSDILKDHCPHIQIVGTADSVGTAVFAIRESQPDIVFLDINMPRGSGFDVLEKVGDVKFEVIFTTAHDEYALQAIKVAATDYLLKPIDPDELIIAVSKANQNNREKAAWQSRFEDLLKQLSSNGNQKVSFPTLTGAILLDPEEITHCQADGAYTTLFLKGQPKMMISTNIGEIEQKLSSKGFFRTHNSYLVNLKHVRQYYKGNPGYIELTDRSSVTLSRRRRDGFLRVLEG